MLGPVIAAFRSSNIACGHRSQVAAEPQTDLALAKCLSHPKAVAGAIRKHAPDAVLVVFETGPRAPWFHRELTADGRPAVGIDAKHAKAALDTAPNKTDANDADGLALLAEAGFFREVRVKSWEAMRAEQSR